MPLLETALTAVVSGGAVGGVIKILDWRRTRSQDPLTERELTELQRLRRQVDALTAKVDELHSLVAKLIGESARESALRLSAERVCEELRKEVDDLRRDLDAMTLRAEGSEKREHSVMVQLEQMRTAMLEMEQERDEAMSELAKRPTAPDGVGRGRRT